MFYVIGVALMIYCCMELKN